LHEHGEEPAGLGFDPCEQQLFALCPLVTERLESAAVHVSGFGAAFVTDRVLEVDRDTALAGVGNRQHEAHRLAVFTHESDSVEHFHVTDGYGDPVARVEDLEGALGGEEIATGSAEHDRPSENDGCGGASEHGTLQNDFEQSQ
jgi:hypothetical protein